MIRRLEDLDLSRPIHFIGIGGSGMSGIAAALRKMGFIVSGSDISSNGPIEHLREMGATVAIGHNGANIPSNTQVAVVVAGAIKPDNPEFMAAKARNIPIMKYAQMLGAYMGSRTGVAIAGTHGKTTTTAMTALALRQLGCDPSFVVGGVVPQLGGGSGIGSSDFLVVEACEHDRSFHNYHPRYAIITNIEEDHLDYYSGLDEIVDSFHEFARHIPKDGILVYGASSTNTARFVNQLGCRTVSCALEREADYWADAIRFRNGKSLYRLHTHKTPSGEPESCAVALNTFGRHNVINSLGAIALVHQILQDRGIRHPLKKVAESVSAFRGVHRRFEIVSEKGGICIVDDYAHHPTAVQTVLKSSKAFFKGRRIVAVFQPHQHSRTRFLLKDFARSFQYADLVLVPDIYFVRDSEIEKSLIHARDLVREIVNHKGNAIYIPSFDEIETFLANNLNRGDVLLTMGAGTVWQIGARLAEKIGRSDADSPVA